MTRGKGCLTGCAVVMGAPLILLLLGLLIKQTTTPRYRAFPLPAFQDFKLNAVAVNDRLQVVGNTRSATGELRSAFVWDPSDGYTEFTVPDAERVFPESISSTGWITGRYVKPDNGLVRGRYLHSFIRDPSGALIVNEDQSVRWERIRHVNSRGTALIPLRELPGEANQRIGITVGYLLRTATGEFQTLDFGIPPDHWVAATGFSDSDEILGILASPSSQPQQFYWSAETGMAIIQPPTGEEILKDWFTAPGQVAGRITQGTGTTYPSFQWTLEKGFQIVTTDPQPGESFALSRTRPWKKKIQTISWLNRSLLGLYLNDWFGLNTPDFYAYLDGQEFHLNAFTEGEIDWERIDIQGATPGGVLFIQQNYESGRSHPILLLPPGMESP